MGYPEIITPPVSYPVSWSIDPPLAQSAPDPHDEETMDA